MSAPKERLMSGVRTLCGEPPDSPLPEGLPSHLIFETLNDIESSMLRDLDLGTANRRVASEDIHLSEEQEDFPFPNFDFHSPSYVYLQTDPSTNIWWPVEIVEHSSLGEATAQGKLAVAFSGSPPIGYFSWMPDGQQVLRVWYERAGNDDPLLADSTDIGNLYDEYLKNQAAAQCREFLKMEVGNVLKARIVKSERQWQKFVNRGTQRGLGAKAPAYRRYGQRAPGIDRTRFFVP